MRSFVAAIALCCLLFAGNGCASQQPVPVTTQPATADEPATRQTEHDTAVLQAAKYLTGRFTSAEQAAQDADYFEIELHVARIWAERDDAIWLYVEQAAASALDRPYRQRVYEVVPLVDDDDARPADVVSKVHTLPGDPLDFAGGAADTALLDTISPADLTLRDGCAVYLRQTENGDFVGSTRGQGCVSSLAGAAYAISTVSLTATELRSWDRGFDENGDQVWGAEKGPYVFVRVAD